MRSCCTHNIHLLCGQCAENIHFLLCGHLHSRAHYALNPLCGVPSDSMSVSGALKETCTPALRVGATPAYRDDEQVEVPVPAPSAAPTPPSNSARDERGGRWDQGPEELAARCAPFPVGSWPIAFISAAVRNPERSLSSWSKIRSASAFVEPAALKSFLNSALDVTPSRANSTRKWSNRARGWTGTGSSSPSLAPSPSSSRSCSSAECTRALLGRSAGSSDVHFSTSSNRPSGRKASPSSCSAGRHAPMAMHSRAAAARSSTVASESAGIYAGRCL